MKKFTIALLAVAAALAITPAAMADQFTFDVSGSGFTADLLLSTTAVAGSPGEYLVTGVSGTFSDPYTNSAVITLAPSAYVANAGTPGATANNGVWEWDNLLSPGASGNTKLDWSGLLIDIPQLDGEPTSSIFSRTVRITILQTMVPTTATTIRSSPIHRIPMDRLPLQLSRQPRNPPLSCFSAPACSV